HEQLCHFVPARLIPIAGHHGGRDQQEKTAEERSERRENQIPFHALLPATFAASIAVLHDGRTTSKAAKGWVAAIAFSSEVDAGSREENASKQDSRASVLIQSEPKLQLDVKRLSALRMIGSRRGPA